MKSQSHFKKLQRCTELLSTSGRVISMFYLIGGTPRSGKTTIAKKLSADLNIPWISSDTLETIVSRYVSEDKYPELFPKSVVRKATHQSNDELYEKYSAHEIKDLYIKQAETLWNALVSFIECEARTGHDYIMEGYHIAPELVIQLQDTYSMRSIFVGRENLGITLESIRNGTAQDDWVLAKTATEETYPKIAEMLALFSTDVRTEAEKRGLKYIEIVSDFNASVNQAVEYLKGSE